uniref:UDP-2,3-diacylglucosamine diphosphatase n=1 Tax=Thermofilum pendens TaxID=2269 RepID=A0A7J3X927_THEPE
MLFFFSFSLLFLFLFPRPCLLGAYSRAKNTLNYLFPLCEPCRRCRWRALRYRLVDLAGLQVPLISLEEGEEAVVLSDTHLGLRLGDRVKDKHEELAAFISRMRRDPRVKLFILLGDIFELWSAPLKDVVTSSYEPLRELARSDATVVFVAGNHDRVLAGLRLMSARGAGDVLVAPELLLLDAGGKRVLLFHGHQLDAAFLITKSLWKAQSYVYMLSEALSALPGNLEWVLALLSLFLLVLLFTLVNATTPLVEFVLLLAAIFLVSPPLVLVWRRVQDRVWYSLIQPIAYRLSRGRLRGKSVRTLAVSKPLAKLVSLVEELMGRVDVVVFGHTHIPELIVENRRVVANSGSWIENDGQTPSCTYVRISSKEVKLARWSEGAEVVLGEALL